MHLVFHKVLQITNLHVGTHKTVVGSKRRIIQAPIQQVVISCIEVPTIINNNSNNNNNLIRLYISSFVSAQG